MLTRTLYGVGSRGGLHSAYAIMEELDCGLCIVLVTGAAGRELLEDPPPHGKHAKINNGTTQLDGAFLDFPSLGRASSSSRLLPEAEHQPPPLRMRLRFFNAEKIATSIAC